MVVKQHNLAAVDIGQHTVNIVQGNSQGIIMKAASVRVPDGVITGGRVASMDMLAATLQEARVSAKISTKNCVLVIGGREVIIRYFNLPKMSESQLIENIISELSPFLPFSAEDYTIDYCIKDVVTQGKSVEYKVMVAAIHNEVILPYVEAFRSAGLNLKRVEVRDNCYEKVMMALAGRNVRQAKNFGIIDIGASTTTVSAFSDGMFFVNNSSAIAGNNFRDRIGELYGLNPVVAEEKKIELSKKSYAGQDKEVLNLMNEFFEKIVSDAVRVFEFFRSQNDQRSIDEIYICGGSSAITGIAAYIESSSDIHTIEMRDVIKVLFNPRILQGLELEKYAAAVVATFKEVD